MLIKNNFRFYHIIEDKPVSKGFKAALFPRNGMDWARMLIFWGLVIGIVLFLFLNVFTYSPWSVAFIVMCWTLIIVFGFTGAGKFYISQFKFLKGADYWIYICLGIVVTFYIGSMIAYIITIV